MGHFPAAAVIEEDFVGFHIRQPVVLNAGALFRTCQCRSRARSSGFRVQASNNGLNFFGVTEL
jgi:hypothetical protein